MKITPVFFGILFFVFNCLAQDNQTEAFIKSLAEKSHVPGISVAAVKDGKLVFAKGYGLANIETKAEATEKTIYPLGSLTKPFTATAIMLLVEEGTINLEDRICKYSSDCPDSWNKVSIRNLLTHTSGIKDFINDNLVDQKIDTTPQEIIQRVAQEPLNFQPGEKFSYSNTNYILLGNIIEKMSGKTWDEFLKERVFIPLQMNATHKQIANENNPQNAEGYIWYENKLQKSWSLNPAVWNNADGGLVSTVEDLAKFAAALSNGILLKPSTLEEMRKPMKLSDGTLIENGLGWEIRDVRGHLHYEHGGRRSGASAQFTTFASDNLTVIVLTNQKDFDITEVVNTVAGQFSPMLKPISMLEEQSVNIEITNKIKQWMKDVADGNQNSDLMTPQFANIVIPDASKSFAYQLDGMQKFASLGCDNLKVLGMLRNGSAVSQVCYYKILANNLISGEQTIYQIVYFTPDGKITDYDAVKNSAPTNNRLYLIIGISILILLSKRTELFYRYSNLNPCDYPIFIE